MVGLALKPSAPDVNAYDTIPSDISVIVDHSTAETPKPAGGVTSTSFLPTSVLLSGSTSFSSIFFENEYNVVSAI